MIANHIFNIEKQVTISAGVASYEQNDDVLSIIDRADKHLYQAKKLGKSLVVSK